MKIWRVAGMLCALGIAISIAMPFAAVSAAERAALPAVAPPGEPQATPSHPPVDLPVSLGVRPLPLLTDQANRRVSPDGVTLDQAAVLEAGRVTAARLGLDWDELSTLQTKSGGMHQTSIYPEVVDLIESSGAADAVRTQQPDVVDLSTLVVLAGLPYSGGIAQGLLLFDKNSLSSCDTALNLAFVDSLSEFPTAGFASQAAPIENALAACGDDATALWLAAELGRDSIRQWVACQATIPLAEPPNEPIALARRLQEVHPDIAAGYTAEASIIMTQASEEARYNVRPFTVRQRWIDAAGLLELAQGLSSNPEITLARAQTLTGLGQTEVAAELLRTINDKDLGFENAGSVAAWIASGNRDYERARELVAAIPAEPGGQPPANRNLARKGGYFGGLTQAVVGRMRSTAVVLKDANMGYGGCGASTAFDGGFAPLSRVSGVAPGSMETPNLAELAYLTDSEANLTVICGAYTYWNTPAICSLVDSNEAPIVSTYARQDLLRAAGRYAEASAVIDAFLQRDPDARYMLSLRGEIRLLEGDVAGASADFEESLTSRQADLDHNILNNMPDADHSSGWVRLRLGYAHQLQGDLDAAKEQYSQAKPLGKRKILHSGDWVGDVDDTVPLTYYRTMLLAGLAAQQGDYESALNGFSTAIGLAEAYFREAKDRGAKPFAGGVAEQNVALAATHLGRFDAAVSYAKMALVHDPLNPLYVETLAEAERGQLIRQAAPLSERPGAGNSGGVSSQQPAANPENLSDLIARYRAALELDPTLFSSWNNLGVLLSRDGQHEAARDAFRHSIAAKPDYGIGWYNFGSELMLHGEWTELLAAEGALGIANKQDPSLRSLAPGTKFDDEIYQSGLDLSKVLPADWTLASHARPSTTLLTVALVALIALRVAGALGQDKVNGWLLEKAVQRNSRLGDRWRRWAWWPAWTGLVASAIILSFFSGASTPSEALLCAPLGVALAAIPLVVRRLVVDQSNQPGRQLTPVLGVAASGLLMLVGIAWPPVAYDTQASERHPARRIVPVAIAVCCLLMLLPAITTAVPTARIGVAAAVATLGAVLLPVPPADGAYQRGLVSSLFTAGLVALTVVQAMGMV